MCCSGDAKASNSYHLINACKGKYVSLLTHESTFDDDERGLMEAKKRRHSTALEALQFANVTRAKACVLTHFSNRHSKNYFPDHVKRVVCNRCCSNAFDSCPDQAADNFLDSSCQFPNVKCISAAFDGMLITMPETGHENLSLASELVLEILICDEEWQATDQLNAC